MTKQYTKKVHLCISASQLKKLKADSENLGMKQVDIVRSLIDKKHVYSKILAKKIRIDGKCGGLLNQVAKVLNTTSKLGEAEQAQLDRIERHLARSNKIMERIARK